MTISRRSLMGLTAAAAASSLMPLTEALAKAPLADCRTVAEVLAMRPEDMALASPRIALCRRFLTQAAKELTDASLSRTTLFRSVRNGRRSPSGRRRVPVGRVTTRTPGDSRCTVR